MKPQHQLFIDYVLAGNSPTEAARKAGYSSKSAARTASKLMKLPHIKDAMTLNLDKIGITYQKALQPIADALQATKIVTTKDGEAYNSGIPDHAVRLNAATKALQILTLINKEKPRQPKEAKKIIDQPEHNLSKAYKYL